MKWLLVLGIIITIMNNGTVVKQYNNVKWFSWREKGILFDLKDKTEFHYMKGPNESILVEDSRKRKKRR